MSTGTTRDRWLPERLSRTFSGTIEGCYDRRVGPRQCMWLAVRADRGKRRAIQASDLIPGRVTLSTEEEIAILDDPALKPQARATRRCRQHRLVRMYFEAYGQGGVLTVLDLSLIMGVSQKVICGHIHITNGRQNRLSPFGPPCMTSAVV